MSRVKIFKTLKDSFLRPCHRCAFKDNEKYSQSFSKLVSSLSIDYPKYFATMGSGNGNHNSRINIGTHDGQFHCDEVLAITMLRLLPAYQDAEVIRTRDESILKTCDIVVDVGGVYDPASKRFDHHQRSFTDTMKSLVPGAPWTTRLSSAGLVYVHFGKDVIAQLAGKSVNDKTVEMVYNKIYENLIEEIDAVDNGVNLCDCKPAYRVTTTLSSQVGRLNPSWRDPNPNPTEQFNKALDLVRQEFVNRVKYYSDDWLAAYQIVSDAVQQRFDIDKSGQILELGGAGCPWKDHLRTIEISNNIEGEIKFMIYSDEKGNWRVQAVPISPESFTSRMPLKKDWWGLRDKQLQEASNIPTAIFVHANGFIGGAADRGDALELARSSLADTR